MLLRHALDDDAGATSIEEAVDDALTAGAVPRDLGGVATTDDVTRAVLRAIEDTS